MKEALSLGRWAAFRKRFVTFTDFCVTWSKGDKGDQSCWKNCSNFDKHRGSPLSFKNKWRFKCITKIKILIFIPFFSSQVRLLQQHETLLFCKDTYMNEPATWYWRRLPRKRKAFYLPRWPLSTRAVESGLLSSLVVISVKSYPLSCLSANNSIRVEWARWRGKWAAYGWGAD